MREPSKRIEENTLQISLSGATTICVFCTSKILVKIVHSSSEVVL
jgi:hypothetical protein